MRKKDKVFLFCKYCGQGGLIERKIAEDTIKSGGAGVWLIRER